MDASPMGIAFRLLAVLVLVLANAFFVAIEFALVAVDRSHLAQDVRRNARVAEGLLKQLSFHLSGAQLGITITSIGLGFIARPAIGNLLEPWLGESRSLAVVLALAMATVFQLVLGELVPKGMAIAKPMETSVRLSSAMLAFSTLFGPLTRILNNAANRMVRALGIEPVDELASSRTLEELQSVIQSSARNGGLDEEAVALLDRSIRFSEKKAADALVPRTQVEALDADAVIMDMIKTSHKTGFSRFPVMGDGLDDIVGVVHVKQALGLDAAARNSTSLSEIMSEALYVPEARELELLLADLRSSRVPMAVVVDEHGGTAGIITVEDLIEEIVGEIHDEYDRSEPLLTGTLVAGGHHWLPGSLHPDEVREASGFEIPEGDYDTLAGFVLSRLQTIPVEGDSLSYENWTITVKEMDRRRIAAVELVAPEEAEGDSAAAGQSSLLNGSGADKGSGSLPDQPKAKTGLGPESPSGSGSGRLP